MAQSKQDQASVDAAHPKGRDSFVENVPDQATHEKGVIDIEGGDYSGAVAKTSPEEFALVRKLDLYIMPTLWAMYFLNYVSRILSAGFCSVHGH